MTSRERVQLAISHKAPDRVPIDLGSTGQTGISASTLYKLREDLGLEQKAIPICEVFQMLGRVEKDLRDALGVDVMGVNGSGTMLGFAARPGKPFRMCDGTPVLLPEAMEYDVTDSGSVYAYPQADRSAPPSVVMPRDGFFFDNIDRSPGFDEDELTPLEDYKDSFAVMSEEEALFVEKRAKELYESTDYALIGNLGGGGLGDAAMIPGPHEKRPKGIRRMEDWLMAHLLYPDYIRAVFGMQTDVMLKNLEIYRQAVGERIQIVWISGTDFGTQNGGFIARESFRELYMPFYKRINDWVHENTGWKTFYHSCGAITDYLDDFAEMGMDILNPVQLSAAGMDAKTLKEKYGEKLVFWGGGVDTQAALPYGSPDEVYRQATERLGILSNGGGYVFAAIHNIVAKTPVENLRAMFRAVWDYNGYTPQVREKTR